MRIIDEFENYKKKIIFTSGSPPNENKDYGGGIYEIKWNKHSWKNEKKISGNCYGLIRYNNNYVAIDSDKGIFEFNNKYKILRSKNFQSSVDHMDYHIQQKEKNFMLFVHIWNRYLF